MGRGSGPRRRRPPGRSGGGEVKVVYREGHEIRAVRGRLVGESDDGLFLILRRRDGELRVAKAVVIKIEEGG